MAKASARDLVLRYGFNATAYQILNPGIEHWMDPSGAAVVGFVRQAGMWVAAGAPVCSRESLSAVVRAFEHDAAAHDARVCYVCAASRLHDLLAKRKDHATIAIGAEPVWRPKAWPGMAQAHPGVRSQIRRAQNKGVEIEHWISPSAKQTACLQRVLHAWLAARPMPPMHFLVEPEALRAGVGDRVLLVAQHAGEMTAFLLASPIPQRRGYLIEQIIRKPNAPNGTSELLIDAAMRHLADDGCDHVTLGLVALAHHADAQIRSNPPWLRLLMAWARAHGRRFYHFDGLEMFRTKLAPAAWEPVYAISNEAHFSPATLYAIAAAFTDGRPIRTLAQALGRAVQQEAKWMLGK